MMINKQIISLFILVCLLCIIKQSSYGQLAIDSCKFESPVKHQVRLSGSFGELRSNHFHAGIDIKSSNGHSGDPIYAAEAGYISRIKIQSAGYGRSIYITHPNGYTTVYAHLSTFRGDIEKYVRDEQYKHKKFGLNLYPGSKQFRLNKGDVIGTMGNTGSSHGPHLHFEIRESKSEVPHNPIKFNSFCEDNIPPVIKELKLYGLDQSFHSVYESKQIIRNQKNGILDTLIIPAWRMGMAIRVYDQSNGSHNKNGIYSIVMKVDGKQLYKFSTDQCGFHETRYINAHMDYAEKIVHKKYWHKCFILPANHLSMYDRNGQTGVFEIYQKRARKVEVAITDAHGNLTEYAYWVKRKNEFKIPKSKPFQFQLSHIEDNYLTISGMSLYLPKGSLYQDTYLKVKQPRSVDKGRSFKIGSKSIPLHKYAQLTIKLKNQNFINDKLVLTAYDNKKAIYNSYGGILNDSLFKIKTRELGEFKLQLDTIAPSIKTIKFANKTSKSGQIKFKITDNFNPVGKAKDLRCEAMIDGKWALLEYDLKSKTITHPLDGRTSLGEHKFELIVKDDRNNISKFEKTFTVQ